MTPADREFRATVIAGAELVGKELAEPGGDWLPVLLVERSGGKAAWDISAFSPSFMDSATTQDAMVEALVPLTRGAVRAALILSAWMTIDYPARASQRTSVLVVHFVTQDAAWQEYAQITRDSEDRPKLGGWQRFEGDGLTGPFADGLKLAMRRPRGRDQ